MTPTAEPASAMNGSASGDGETALPQVDEPNVPPSIFASNHRLIREGDVVIVYHARDNVVAITVTAGQMVPSKFGHFSQSDMIGVAYGSKFPTKTGKGFTFLLRPTPELWTLALPHRTQILYLPDIAFITSQLDIGPGSRVIEAGALDLPLCRPLSSLPSQALVPGSFSHAVARAVGSHGRIFSFEFHEERFQKAREEFRSHGLLAPAGAPIVLQHRDVVKDGFGDIDEIDAVFLDVPAPWDALEAAKAVMTRKRISRVCCFSPCIEQVQRTVTSLNALGFSDVAMYETLIRNHEPATVPMPTIDGVISRIAEVEVRKEARRERQIKEAKRKRQEKDAAVAREGDEARRGADEMDGDSAIPSAKRVRLEEGAEASSAAEASEAPATEDAVEEVAAVNGKPPSKKPESGVLKTSRPVDLLRGHTSFLTFATLLPDLIVSMTNGDVSMQDVASEDGPATEPAPDAAATTLPTAGEIPLNGGASGQPLPNGQDGGGAEALDGHPGEIDEA